MVIRPAIRALVALVENAPSVHQTESLDDFLPDFDSGPVLDKRYSYDSAGPARRLARWSAGIGPITWLLAQSLHHIDRAVSQISGGRQTCASLLTGLPVVMLTTTGRRSGRQNTVPVMGIPDGKHVVVVAVNFGRQRNPAWCHNLMSNPAATLSVQGTQRTVRARLATGHELERLWVRGTNIYPAWNIYRRRAGKREIPIFVLEDD